MYQPEKHQFQPFTKKVWLASPTMHGQELEYMTEAFTTNWMSTVGKNIDEVEREMAEKIGVRYAVALASGTAALHLATRLAGEKLYGPHRAEAGALQGRKVFCTDMTFAATINPVAYENGEAVFIDTEYDTWNMDPAALEEAFRLYPDTKLIVCAHLYGTPGKIRALREIADRHGALILEDAAESVGALYDGKQTGTFGELAAISFNGNKIITGSSGGMFLTDSREDADQVRKWSTQSREPAPLYQHEEIGYNYRMSNVIAGVIRGQFPHLDEHIAQKKAIWQRYAEGLAGLPVTMNPWEKDHAEPNYWLSCMLIDEEAMCGMTRDDLTSEFVPEHGKSCPTEILEAIAGINAEGRPIWKPMHAQPIYKEHAFVTRYGLLDAAAQAGADRRLGADGRPLDIGMDIFRRGLCLPSDNKMTPEEQDRIIEVIRACFE